MKNVADLAFVTPTFVPDLARCELLVESLDRFAPDIRHYLIVDEHEHRNFRHLESRRTTLLRAEEVIGLKQIRMPWPPNYWLSWRTLPMRGWMRQQLLKLAVSGSIASDILVFLDSDVTFVRPFSEELIEEGGKWGLLDVDYSTDMVPRWTRIACELLGLDPAAVPLRGHVGHMIVWTREHVEALHRRIEDTTGLRWVEAIGRKLTVSEYILYGVFIRCIVGYDESRHVPSTTPLVRQPWSHDLKSVAGLRDFICAPEPNNVALMVHSKFSIPVSELRPLFHETWRKWAD